MDFPGMSEVKSFLKQFDKAEQLYLKVGMELFYAAGPDIIKYIKSLGHDVFLDLKLHDIPNTV
ncbi:MAG: orotidine 5'-phosphate decarboxylase, partial [Lactococcus plantarum]|nr:orotidine 5'-phosphate decarboxylase [Lactococcus plantarum]